MRLQTFIREESGAVTVDYVVLLAGLIALSLAATLSIGGSIQTYSDALATTLGEEIDFLGGIDNNVASTSGTGESAAESTGESAGESTGTSGSDGTSASTGASTGSSTSASIGSSSDGTSSSTGSTGNPGNDKDVGKAGENPNGSSDWGSGSRGRSN